MHCCFNASSWPFSFFVTPLHLGQSTSAMFKWNCNYITALTRCTNAGSLDDNRKYWYFHRQLLQTWLAKSNFARPEGLVSGKYSADTRTHTCACNIMALWSLMLVCHGTCVSVCVVSSRTDDVNCDSDHCSLLPTIFLQKRLEQGTVYSIQLPWH